MESPMKNEHFKMESHKHLYSHFFAQIAFSCCLLLLMIADSTSKQIKILIKNFHFVQKWQIKFKKIFFVAFRAMRMFKSLIVSE
jgi:hypothetical protein